MQGYFKYLEQALIKNAQSNVSGNKLVAENEKEISEQEKS